MGTSLPRNMYFPGSHLHASRCVPGVLPAVVDDPSGQKIHDTSLAPAYFPDGQSRHAVKPPFGSCPAAHCVHCSLPAGATWLPSQGLQLSSPTPLKYPGSHSTQKSLLLLGTSPNGHAAQLEAKADDTLSLSQFWQTPPGAFGPYCPATHPSQNIKEGSPTTAVALLPYPGSQPHAATDVEPKEPVVVCASGSVSSGFQQAVHADWEAVRAVL